MGYGKEKTAGGVKTARAVAREFPGWHRFRAHISRMEKATVSAIILAVVVLAASSIEMAAAAQRHAERHHVRFRSPNIDQLRDPATQAETSPKFAPGTSWVCTNLGCWCN
jgi:hypothetical protein